MRELKFPASFVSAIRRFEATWAAAETEGASAAAIRGVYAATEAAQRFYRNRRYEDAIREFKRAQSSIYRLLNPKHSLDQHIADDRLMLSWKNNRRASRGDVIAVGGEHPEGCRAHGRSGYRGLRCRAFRRPRAISAARLSTAGDGSGDSYARAIERGADRRRKRSAGG
jgi:hypothetical protein